MEAPKFFKNGKKINYAQVDNRPLKLQPLEQPRILNYSNKKRYGVKADEDADEYEDNIGPRNFVYGHDNLPRQIQQPLILHQRAQQSGPGENLDQQVDNVDQDHPERPGALESGRLHDKFLEEEEENQMDDDVDGRILHKQNFVHGNEVKVLLT